MRSRVGHGPRSFMVLSVRARAARAVAGRSCSRSSHHTGTLGQGASKAAIVGRVCTFSRVASRLPR
jgi:hypothetical protein